MAASVRAAAGNGTPISAGSAVAVITAAETNQLSTGAGRVGNVIVWGADAGTTCVATFYDATTGTTLPFFSWKTADGLGVFPIQVPYHIGLRVITSGTLPGSGGITVVFQGPHTAA